MSSNLTGKQDPRIAVPANLDEFPYTDGSDAAELSKAYGIDPDPWQQLVLNYWLTRTDDDKFAFTSCGLPIPRQNGKNAVLEMREWYGLCIIGEKILHTAHRVDTARKAFLRLVTFFENPEHPELQEMVVSIRRTNGQEAISLINGGSIEFSSRVNGGSRGSTYDVVVFDEAQELTDDQMESIMSTMAAAPLGNRQMIFTGTPPSPVSPGTVFARRRKDALSNDRGRICWLEWSVEEIGDVWDRTRWYEANPALGYRIEEEFTEEECRTLSPDGFARERLGWWSDEGSANAAIKKSAWIKGIVDTVPEPDTDDKIAYGIKFTPDGKNYALSVAVKNKKEKTLVECIDYAPTVSGINALADWVIARKSQCSVVVIDGKSNTGAFVRKLQDGGFPTKAIKLMNSNDVCSAASVLLNAIEENEIQHIAQPTLDDSAIAAQKRSIGSNGGWGFGDGITDCAPIESVSFALWGVLNTKRRPGRRSKLL